MNARQVPLVVALLAVAAAVVVAPAVGTVGTATLQSGNGSDNASDAGASEASLGAQLSGFMQASSADADGSVDTSMWAAQYNDTNGSAKQRLVKNRVTRLDGRLDRLEARMTALEAAHENGTLPEPAYVAQASHLTARIDALKTAINQTDAAAAQAGVEDSRLDRLRQNASELSGREVAEVARGLPVITPPGFTERSTGGPPVKVGPPDAIGSGGNVTGPPDDAESNGNGSGVGLPDEPGQGSDHGLAGANGNDAGLRNGSGTNASDAPNSSDDTDDGDTSGGSGPVGGSSGSDGGGNSDGGGSVPPGRGR